MWSTSFLITKPSFEALQTDIASAATSPTSFDLAFDAWLKNRGRHRALQQASSLAVYRSMWDAFTRWCVERQINLPNLTGAELEAFIEERADPDGISDRHAWRWLMLLDSVLQQRPALAMPSSALPRGRDEPHAESDPAVHHASRAAAEVFARRPDWRYANASHRDTPPEYLTAPQARHLVGWLLGSGAAASMPGAAAGSWQSVRNRAALGLHLGAGLTPGDLRVLTVASVVVAGGPVPTLPWRLHVPAHGAVSARDVPLANWAGRLLQQWLKTRQDQQLPGTVLFPGTRKGRPWSKVSHYGAMGATMQAAGVDNRGGGSYLLRHTFALRQLRRGHDPAEVSRWLGVTDPGVMARYQGLAFDADPPV